MIWLFLLMVWWSLNLSIGYVYSRRWIPAAITLAALVMNIGSVVIQVEIMAVDAAHARFAAKCVDAPKEVPYRPGVPLCPGQTAVIEVPAVIFSEPGTDIDI